MSTIIEMPKLSDTMTVGTVVKWFKNVGDAVNNGDILAEIETDKATMELENFDDGIILSLLAGEGDEVEIGKPLAIVGEKGEEIPDLECGHSGNKSPKEEPDLREPSSQRDDSPSPLSPPTESSSSEIDDVKRDLGSLPILASPLAKKLAKEHNLDLAQIQGSGPRGRITKKDLGLGKLGSVKNDDKIITESSTSPTRQSNQTSLLSKRIPLSKIRSIIASRLSESKQTIPHFYLQKEINAEPLCAAQESINRRLAACALDSQGDQTKVSLNDLILLATAMALPQIPEINASWGENEIIYHGEVNLAFGVAIDEGLVTPVIRQANSLNLNTISREARSLIERARQKKLTPNEMQGSTFTVTNLGMFGIDFFSGIINPPNAAILAVGAKVKKPVVGPSGTIQVGETMTLGLSCDHRLVDGAIGARFLKILSELLECPASMLV